MAAVHAIRESTTRVVTRKATTYCGLVGVRDRTSHEFITANGRRFDAVESHVAVTCKSCKRRMTTDQPRS